MKIDVEILAGRYPHFRPELKQLEISKREEIPITAVHAGSYVLYDYLFINIDRYRTPSGKLYFRMVEGCTDVNPLDFT